MPAFSHLRPLVPIGRAALERGHPVAVAADEQLEPEVRRHGFEHFPVEYRPPDVRPWDADRYARAFVANQRLGLRRDYERHTVFASAHVAERLLPVVRQWRPDFLLRDGADYGAYLAAEMADLPHAAVAGGECCLLDARKLLDRVNECRTGLGLDAVDDPAHPHRHLHISFLPREWDPAHLAGPTVRCYRQPIVLDTAPLDDRIASLPRDRPLVLASLGSSDWMWKVPAFAAVLRTLVEALGALGCSAVVALGADQDPARWSGPRPDNVLLADFVPQQQLLPSCDLFVTHAGFESTRESLVAGVPTVALPLMGDQLVHAARLAAVGAGLALDTRELTVEMLVAACRTALDDPCYRWAARSMQRRILALPGLDRLVDDLARRAG
jgi:UDP:flavonoid glycosyltransferase YjiC (YdhE family)